MKRLDQVSVFPAVVPLAHQGGWDEILMVVAPLAFIGGLLWLANRRVSAQLDAEQAATEASDDPGDGADPADGDGAGGVSPEPSGPDHGEGSAIGGNGHR